jgi:hypothetical protein
VLVLESVNRSRRHAAVCRYSAEPRVQQETCKTSARYVARYSRVSDVIERFGVDAYFLDISGGYVNNTSADMHEGTRRLVLNLRAKYPNVLCAGENPYDALHGFIPLYQAGNRPHWRKYSRFFQHLASPAPGRGSSGVNEAGFGRFNPETLSLNENAIPTLQVVEDTFTKYRDVMAEIIRRAKLRAGIA